MFHEVTKTERETVGRKYQQRWWIPSIVSFNELIWLAVFASTAWYIAHYDDYLSPEPAYLFCFFLSFTGILAICCYEHWKGVRFQKYWVIIARRLMALCGLVPGFCWVVQGALMLWYGQEWMIVGTIMILISLYYAHEGTGAAYAAARSAQHPDSTES